ncbi:RNA polymerase sigma-54 factor, partial [human gut metagenome]
YSYIKPLTLREVSSELDVHDSTISRTIKDKYILTSYGTIKIKDLFPSGITNNTYIIKNIVLLYFLNALIENYNLFLIEEDF